MFDLEFFRRQAKAIDLLTKENTNVLLSYHQTIVSRKQGWQTKAEYDSREDRDLELRKYVRLQLLPYFGMKYRPNSSFGMASTSKNAWFIKDER